MPHIFGTMLHICLFLPFSLVYLRLFQHVPISYNLLLFILLYSFFSDFRDLANQRYCYGNFDGNFCGNCDGNFHEIFYENLDGNFVGHFDGNLDGILIGILIGMLMDIFMKI